MKKIVYIIGFLFFVNFTNALHYNFAKLFSSTKIITMVEILLIIAAPFYDIPIQKIKGQLLIKTIQNINIKKVELCKALDTYNRKIHSMQEKDSMENAYSNLDKQVSNTLQELENNAQNENIHNYYKKLQSTKQDLNTMYNNTIDCLKRSASNPSVEKHNACLNIWKNSNHFTKKEQ